MFANNLKYFIILLLLVLSVDSKRSSSRSRGSNRGSSVFTRSKPKTPDSATSSFSFFTPKEKTKDHKVQTLVPKSSAPKPDAAKKSTASSSHAQPPSATGGVQSQTNTQQRPVGWDVPPPAYSPVQKQSVNQAQQSAYPRQPPPSYNTAVGQQPHNPSYGNPGQQGAGYGNPTGYGNPPPGYPGGYGNQPSGYGNPPLGGYGNPASGGYGNPASGGYGNPGSGGYVNPASGGYGNPPAYPGGYNNPNFYNGNNFYGAGHNGFNGQPNYPGQNTFFGQGYGTSGFTPQGGHGYHSPGIGGGLMAGSLGSFLGHKRKPSFFGGGGFGGMGGYGGYGMMGQNKGGFFGKHAFRNILAGLLIWNLVKAGIGYKYRVYNYYNYRDRDLEYKEPQEITLPPNLITLCPDEAQSVCLQGTTALCTTNNTVLCVTTMATLIPCEENSNMSCANTTIPCTEGDPACNGSQSENMAMPCVANANIEGFNASSIYGQQAANLDGNSVFCVTTMAIPEEEVKCDENQTENSPCSGTGFVLPEVPEETTINPVEGNTEGVDLSPGLTVTDGAFKVTDEASRINDEDSKITDEDSKITDEASRINDEASRMTEEDSKITYGNSKITDEDSEITDEDSKITEEDSKITDEDSVIREEASIVTDEAFKVLEEASKIAAEITEETDVLYRITDLSSRVPHEGISTSLDFTTSTAPKDTDFME